jgi:hypothetical protein
LLLLSLALLAVVAGRCRWLLAAATAAGSFCWQLS